MVQSLLAPSAVLLRAIADDAHKDQICIPEEHVVCLANCNSPCIEQQNLDAGSLAGSVGG